MFFALLYTNPLLLIVWVVAVLLSLTVHEFSHAWMAGLRGDRTAEREGRLSLNPLDHVDIYGLLAFLFLGFGWAKPVPYNPYNLKNPKWDSVAIALAGPGANLVIAAIAAIAFRLLVTNGVLPLSNLLSAFLVLTVFLNLALMIFNAVPVHPLDGSKLFFALFDAPKYTQLRNLVAQFGPQVLMFMVVLSFLTPFDPFFFVTGPSYAACGAFLGGSCQSFLGFILNGA